MNGFEGPIASWAGPPWAQCSSQDDDLIEYHRSVAAVVPDDEDEPFHVELVQCEAIDPDGRHTEVHREAPRVRIAGVRLSAPKAMELADALISAVALIT